MCPPRPLVRAFLLQVHHGRFEEGLAWVDATRAHLHNTLSALVAESYKRAYTSLVFVQQLAELEEVRGLRV